MKKAIDVDDIRAGMKIRWEDDRETAYEFRAKSDCARFSRVDGQHYLIEPRKPAVEWPEGVTLGWLGSAHYGSTLGVWQKTRLPDGRGIWGIASMSSALDSEVTAFTPATAVPTAALDELRAWRRQSVVSSSALEVFLYATDEANGGTA